MVMDTDARLMQEFDDCIFLNKLGMIVLGIWPVHREASWLRILGLKIRLVIYIVYFFISLLLCAQWIDIYSSWGKNVTVSEILLSNVFILASMLKLSSFLKHISIFRDILLTMRANWLRAMHASEPHNKDLMYKTTMKATSWSDKYFLVMGATTMLYITMPISRGIPFQDRRYPFFGRYYFDRDSDVNYVVCYLSQILTGAVIGLANYVTDSIFLVCTYHFCAQLQILQNDLMDLGYKGRMELHGGLASLIRRHQAEIKNVQALQLMFSQSSLLQVLLSCLMICVNGFKLIVSPSNRGIDVLRYLMCLILSLLQILCYCQPGNELILQSQSLDEAIYHSAWIDMDIHSIKSLAFMIQRSQKPLSIAAGKMYVLSLQNFMRIVKTAVSGLSVLQAIYRRNG